MTEEGLSTYTNIQELRDSTDENVTEVFSEYREYLIYYPDSLVFMGNAFLSDSEIYEFVEENHYAYPDSIHIWLGVDGTYSAKGDAFYEAEKLYNKIVPGAGRVIVIIVLLLLCWIGIGVYLTVTSGRVESKDGRVQRSHPERVWTEVLLVLAAALGYGCYRGFLELMKIVESVDQDFLQGTRLQMSGLTQYLIFALYGIYLSLTICVVWYSFVRRLKSKVLWKGSLLYRIIAVMKRVLNFILSHRNTVVSVLVPYNLFLFANLVGVVAIFRQWAETPVLAVVIMVAVIAFDGMIGVFMFRSNAERNEIVRSIEKIHDGEVEYKIDAGSLHGSNKELADAVNNIGEGIRKAVKTSMKDEQMKTDLITNVSHDIKTPLTSIINYVDLLKRLKIEEEPAKSYIDILDGKAQRLKQLTDDLVEASKISSGNIILNNERLNLTELLNQGIGELSEKFSESGLEVIFESSDKPGYIYADSRRMWRVMENLLNNVCKYALRDTRVYVDVVSGNDRVEVSIKNISRQQMNISPEELTERFIRGDSARSTEGSGLGLSIAKSLTRVQGGEFEIYLDGDLFKVTLSFPECKEVEKE
ncbi:MAG: sensor histidine kinase [Acetatifactor sp.]